MKRLFIAINISAELKEMLHGKVLLLNKNVRVVKKESVHVTLVFIGNVGEEEVTSIKKTLGETVLGTRAFSLELKNLQTVNEGRMIWTTFENSKVFESLSNKISKALNLKKSKPQTPHITLARIKNPENENSICIPLGSENFIVDSIGLYESVLKPEGAKYTLIEEFSLR